MSFLLIKKIKNKNLIEFFFLCLVPLVPHMFPTKINLPWEFEDANIHELGSGFRLSPHRIDQLCGSYIVDL